MSRRLDELVEFSNAQHPHCALVVLVDTSGSMSGNMTDVNEGMKTLKDELMADDLASKRVDLAIVTFGGSAQIIHNFSNIEDYEPPVLSAGGGTPMGDAILMASEMIETRKQQYKDKGVDYYRPWIFMMTDGEPTDMQQGDAKWSQVTKLVYEGETKKKFMFFAVAVDNADMDTLKQIAPQNRPPVRLKQGKWNDLFSWLSKSQSSISSSNPGEQIKLESPTGWGEIGI